MEFKNYKILLQTEKYLKKNFSKETIFKYGNIIGFLYQNGFELNCSDEEVEEQLLLFNFFKKEDDFNDLKSLTNIKSDFSVGKKIVSEELYDIVKNSVFVQYETENVEILKIKAKSNWKNIINLVNRINNIFNSEDSEIIGAISNLKNLEDIRSRISFLSDKMEKEILLLTWIKFKELIGIIYSVYIQLDKVKKDFHKFTIYENINSELYGTGGFNPNTNEIDCKYCGAVLELKKYYTTKDISLLKYIAKDILKNGNYTDEKIEYFVKWTNNLVKDNEKARRIIINCLLSGILSLLSLKNNISLIEDKKNEIREERIKNEMLSIMKFAGISKEYLF